MSYAIVNKKVGNSTFGNEISLSKMKFVTSSEPSALVSTLLPILTVILMISQKFLQNYIKNP